MRMVSLALAISLLSMVAAHAEPARKLGSSVQGLMFYASDLRMATLKVGDSTYLVRRTSKADLMHAQLEVVSQLALKCYHEVHPVVERHNNFTPPGVYWRTVNRQVDAALPACVRAKIAGSPVFHMDDISFSSIN